MQLLQRGKRLAGAADDLAADCTMIIVHLLGLDAVFGDHDAPLEAGIAASAIAGKHLDAIYSRHDPALHPARIESLVAFEGASDVDQHGL